MKCKRPQVRTDDPKLDLTTGIANYIYDLELVDTGKGEIVPQTESYLPIWQVCVMQSQKETKPMNMQF